MNRKKPVKKEISQAWLTTYSDMVTLLLTFFVLLYSYSLIDSGKFRSASNSISTALNGGKGAMIQLDGSGDAASQIISGEEGSGSENVYGTVSKFIKDNSLGNYVTVKRGNRGIYIQFNDEILFDTGKAEIKTEGIPLLNKISELIRKLPNQVVIEGHTDNVPISADSKFSSNWDLSSARALSVLKYMTGDRGLSPQRFSISGYGEYRPIVSNETSSGREQNRRVNILILTKDEDSSK